MIDPETGAEVPYGERGQVVMNHVSKGMFIPNNLERDTAIRIAGARRARRRFGQRGRTRRGLRR